MPTYNYKCDKCGKETEEYKTISYRDLPNRCECKGKKIRTVNSVNLVGFIGGSSK
jgi:putative FmdB family regulatory protein